MNQDTDIKGKVYPAPLNTGDKIAILSPATTVKEEYVKGTVSFLQERGFVPMVMPSALGPADGTFAASHEARRKDLRDAIENPEIKAILCTRGGYGCVHLIIDTTLQKTIADNPKWLIGFSDVSALHALWLKCGVASIHGPMAKHISTENPNDPCTEALLRIITYEPKMLYTVPSSHFNHIGNATGELRGGNLAVLNGLSGTPFDILTVREDEDVILFIEDISEAIYAVERMLMRLYLSDSLSRIRGLIIGQFTEYRPDKNFSSMEDMIDNLLTSCGINDIPVAFNFPIGHVSNNFPLVEGAKVQLTVTSENVILKTV